MDSARKRRRAASRQRLHRRRRLAALAVLVALVVVVASSGGGSSQSARRGGASDAARRVDAVVPGGPVAPASVGGLAALWAQQNVVGSQPGTAAAYEAASKRPGPAGYLQIGRAHV